MNFRTVLQNRKMLVRLGVAAPPVLLFLYWFMLVGFSNPASRLQREIEAEAKKTLIRRTPVTFIHQPINQWTRPVKDFYVRLERNGRVSISYGRAEEGKYSAQLGDPARVAGRFEFRNVGTGLRIELMPGGDSADVASVQPIP